MPRWFRQQRQIKQISRSLSFSPAQLDIDDLMPLFVPASFFDLGNWPGPYDLLQAEGVALTWAILQLHQTMIYVNRDSREFWDGRGINWRGHALHNLRRASDERPWTHEYRRDSGEIYAVAMMHEDGLGPSRLLIPDYFEPLFPTGYHVAVPEMSCGIACSLDLSAEESAKMEFLVSQCFSEGTRPLAPGFFEPAQLQTKRESPA